MSDMIKQLLAEYGFLAEDADIERNVKDQISRAQTKDEVDTIAFGLETDDGQIVKVYVNAEHAEKFEQEMAEMLGEVDDIEEALNRVSKDIEIVDVEWPEEEEDNDGEADEVDPNADAELETDGSEVLNSKVHSKENKKKEQQANEDISYGDELTMRLLETSANSIANQLSTVNQHLIYQAILHLGVPELALDKSPYRSAILKGIKSTALEIAHTPAMRNTLKIFIKQQAMDDKKAPDEEPFRGDSAKDGHGRHKGDEYEKGMKAAGVVIEPKKRAEPKMPTSRPHHDEKPSKYEVKESIDDEDSPSAFWDGLSSIMDLLDVSETKELATKVKTSQAFKTLYTKSHARVLGRLTAGVRTKLAGLARAIELNGKEVTEQYTYVDAQELLTLMLRVADDAKGDLAGRVTASQVFKRLMLSARTAFVSVPSVVKSALQKLEVELKKISLTEAEDELSFDAPSDKGAEQQEPEKEPAAATPPKAAPAPSTDASESGVTFEADGDSLKVAYPGGAFELSGESLERALKALNNKQTLSVQLDGGKFATVSPRGSSAVIKLMGTETVIKLTPPDISAFIDAGTQVAEGEPENEPEVKESLEEDGELDRAHALIDKHGDADMDRDELIELLTANDISQEVAEKVATDYAR